MRSTEGTCFARPTGTSFSLKPKLVVRTRGGLSWSRRKLMMSRKPPRSPSWFLLPTETKVVGTFVATPTVYWISKVYDAKSVRWDFC